MSLVLTIYSRADDKNGAHAWVPNVDAIRAVSYIAVQVYEHAVQTEFRAIIRHIAAHQVFSFVHLSSNCVLQLLPDSSSFSLTNQGRTLTTTRDTLHVFLRFRPQTVLGSVVVVVQNLVKARRKATGKAADEMGFEGAEKDT